MSLTKIKYIDVVLINKTMTEEEFNSKYYDILLKRNEYREIINTIEESI